MKIAITGANSRVGQTFIQHILTHSEDTIVAGARSESAFKSFPDSDRVQPCVISYNDVDALAKTLTGADCLVHLAGILMEGKGSSYKSANVDATAAVVAAAEQAGVKHVVFISVVGASVDSPNAYFKSKADAEAVVAASTVSSTIIRTPILLGAGAAGAEAIKWASSNPKPKLLGGGRYTMRPLDIDDLCAAVLNSCNAQRSGSVTHELVGPTPAQYCEIISMAATMRGKSVEVGSFPIGIAKLAATVRGIFKPGGMSPTVIDVITMDEVVAHNGDQALGVTLTPLQTTLEKFITK